MFASQNTTMRCNDYHTTITKAIAAGHHVVVKGVTGIGKSQLINARSAEERAQYVVLYKDTLSTMKSHYGDTLFNPVHFSEFSIQRRHRTDVDPQETIFL